MNSMYNYVCDSPHVSEWKNSNNVKYTEKSSFVGGA